MNRKSRNVVSASTREAPPRPVAAVAPVTIVSQVTIARPLRATARAGPRRPGAIMSTMMIAAARRMAPTSGAMVTRSAQAMLIAPLLPEAEVDRRRAAHAAQHGLDGALDECQDEPRDQPEYDHEGPERDERQELDRLHVGQVVAQPPQEVGELAEDDPLEHPQQVVRREDHRERGDARDVGVVLV